MGVNAIVCVGLSWYLVSEGWEIVGLVGAFIVGRSILTVAYPLIIGRVLGLSPVAQLGGAIRPAIMTTVLFAAAAYGGTKVLANSWVTLVIGTAGVALVVAPVAAFGGLTAAVRRRLWARLVRVIRMV